MPQTTLAPFRDAATLYGTTVARPQTHLAPFLRLGGLFAPTIEQAASEGTALLVNGTPMAGSFARMFEEQIADTGSFSFSVLRDDFAGIDFDDLIQFRLDGTARFLGVVEDLNHVALAQGEEADQIVNVSGRGSLALLDQAVVYPSRGVGALPIEDVRTFSWVAPDFDSTSWPKAKNVNRQRDYATWRAPLPWIWPDTTGYWIWADLPTVNANFAPTGVCLFRHTFTLADDATVRIFCAFDFSGRLYVDGAEMTAFQSFTVGRYVELEMSAGDHVIAARVGNEPKPPHPNPGGFIAAVYTVGAAGLLDEFVDHTNADWDCLPYPTAAPGYTHGEVIRILFEEAGLDADWTLDFSDELDTAGQPWGEFREITVGVGRTILEVLKEMSDSYIDVAAAPGSLMLRAWNRGTRGVTRPAALAQTTDPSTSDFLSLSHQGKRTRMNTALIRYAGGHTEAEDTTSIGTHGVRGQYIEAGHIPGENTVLRIAEELMVSRAQPAFATTGVLFPASDATTPYKAFEVADWISCPDETDTPASMRVQSLTYSEDDDGVVEWPIRLRDQQLELEERHDVWLRRMADGALLGGARVSSRAGKPDPAVTEVTGLTVAEFSFDNVQLTESISPRRPAEVSGNMVEVVAELTTAGSTATVLDVLLTQAGSESTLMTMTIPAGETETEEPLDINPIRANLDKLQIEVTTAGSGAEGLDVQIRAI